jgi:serine/threonine protein kinase
MSLTPGSYVGGYEIIAPLGAGGIGEVYRARDPKLRRQIAIKVLSRAFAIDPEQLAALSHPNILTIHDFGSDRGSSYVVMDLLDGLSLRDLMRKGPLPRWKAVSCAMQIAHGLEAAHARGIVHRDLKPENVFVSAANQVKILDLGLAATDAAALAEPGYVSPEQVRGEPADHRSDIFSFGCVLYEMLCGKRAFNGVSSTETLDAILNSEPPNLSTMSDTSEPLAAIVARCLEKSPAARFQSASDLVEAMNATTVTRKRSQSGLAAWIGTIARRH